jgi:hypothetical protein
MKFLSSRSSFLTVLVLSSLLSMFPQAVSATSAHREPIRARAHIFSPRLLLHTRTSDAYSQPITSGTTRGTRRHLRGAGARITARSINAGYFRRRGSSLKTQDTKQEKVKVRVLRNDGREAGDRRTVR